MDVGLGKEIASRKAAQRLVRAQFAHVRRPDGGAGGDQDGADVAGDELAAEIRRYRAIGRLPLTFAVTAVRRMPLAVYRQSDLLARQLCGPEDERSPGE